MTPNFESDVAPQGSVADPRSVPALEFHAAQLIWGERHLGDVRATLTKVDDGIVLKSLAVDAASFAVNATGAWRGKDAGIAHITGAVTSTDVQNTLTDLGYAELIQAKAGRDGVRPDMVGGRRARRHSVKFPATCNCRSTKGRSLA